ncbi:hypothetical protein AgCh_008012 [Apium graveolens]
MDVVERNNTWELTELPPGKKPIDVKTTFLNGDIQEEVYVSQPEGFVKWGKKYLVYRLLKALNGLRQKQKPGEYGFCQVSLRTRSSLQVIKEFKAQMNCMFDMSDLGKLTYYLGIEVSQGHGYIQLKQSGYARKILEKAGMIECNNTKYPMNPKEVIHKDEQVSRFMERLTIMHQNATKRILRSVKATIDLGLVYIKDSKNNVLTGYSYGDLAGKAWSHGCLKNRGALHFFHVTGKVMGPVTLFIANKSAIDLARNPVFHGRSKHIDICYHFIREWVEKGEIVIKHISSDEQRADALTKALTTVKFERMRKLLGVKAGEVDLAIVADLGTLQRLPQVVGYANAMEH